MSGADAPGAVAWIDSHCHLQDRYRPDDTAVLGALGDAAAAGVVGVVCVGTDAATSRQAVELVGEVRGATGAALPPDFGAWATMGLHPHEARHGVAGLEAALEEALVAHPGTVVAVGECGLDYHYDHSPRPEQRDAFAAQVALAKRHDLTLVVHTREAWDDTLAVLRSEGPPERTVLHCFTGGPEEARRCLDLGAYLSFSGIVTFKGAPEVRDACALCPLDRLLVETDAPFLAPVPHRGQENRPAWVATVGEAVAVVKGVTAPELSRTTVAATGAAFALA
ncbi:MAG TPA: TatD family hydrolase [Acidimicrobiales bacterium]|nr:TatD family hydrolase [Acidimicrobiales bacterium]